MGNSESTAGAMRAAATAFVERVGALAATHPFVDGERTDWHYIPRRRNGLSLAVMGSEEAKVAAGLLATGLSLAGYAAATAIVALEDVLDRLEGGHRHRHGRDYSVTVFGDPGGAGSGGEPWGWRFEGHHVSVNVTLVGDEITAVPLFLGANPAEVLTATGRPVTRPLAAEEDLAIALVTGLSAAQRDRALVDETAPDDILTEAVPRLDATNLPPAGVGLRFAELSGGARDLAHDLVRLYLDRLPADVAAAWWERLEPDLGDVHLALAGRPAHRRPHYYRLLGPRLLVEYDNTQNGANHVHTVLRDPDDDFGDDLLRRHRHEHAHR
ncbi:MAG TPA: DUF3500 domain-containing protein [Acidimicrobiales bacterium]|nr:DUF3500 domain-containing protein [Acidimicrobiales bacterium]